MELVDVKSYLHFFTVGFICALLIQLKFCESIKRKTIRTHDMYVIYHMLSYITPVMLCYITHDMLCYITDDMLCYITHVMLCYITHMIMLYNT